MASGCADDRSETRRAKMSEGLDPVLPYPSGGVIDAPYVNRLVRSIEIYLIRNADRGFIRASTISATSLPTNPYGLRNGDLFVDANGFVKISRANDAYTVGVSSASALGAVTVVTS